MYDEIAVLQVIDDKAVLACAFGALAFLANWTYFYACARAARRDQCSPMALWATTIFIAHDGSFLIHARHWFTDYEGVAGAWMLPLFWCGLIVTFGFELVFLGQTIRYGRNEYAPRLSQRQWLGYVLAALAVGMVFWSVTKTYLDDPIYLMTFLVTYAMCAPATIQALARRGDSSGLDPLLTWTYLAVGVFFVALTVGVIGSEPAGEPFRQGWFLVGSLLVFALAGALIVLQRVLPPPGREFRGVDGSVHRAPLVVS
ncbi:hypothetical protein ASD11_00700 [Aeromicrobium sp. Root495]|uniref:hypothetical protein n=1 Tax=Aeromicrobium sp. Root495 TaxID=1736550 RepID=UPI0006F7928F|nr:hypothetical protein [Aeromicrobium sp. Root495]KQY58224.1 hypothetical protein ASD11_00700 [Aeromicrobium sp. Root495]